MLKKNDYFKLGFIRKTHGVKGEMMLLCEMDTDFDQIGEWLFFNIDECLIPHKINSLRSSTEKTVLFSCQGIETVEDASKYIETDIFLPLEKRENLIDSNSQNTWIGLSVYDERSDATIGTITGFIDSRHNPLLEIENDGEEILLPFNEEFILGIEEQTLFVKVPDGLLDLE